MHEQKRWKREKNLYFFLTRKRRNTRPVISPISIRAGMASRNGPPRTVQLPTGIWSSGTHLGSPICHGWRNIRSWHVLALVLAFVRTGFSTRIPRWMCRPHQQSWLPNVPMAACAQHALVPFSDLWQIYMCVQKCQHLRTRFFVNSRGR
jgi:hypothetical protein